MVVNNSFGKTVDLLHRGMDAASLRQAVIANNLANADVPNFKRTNVNFESQLKKALDSEKYKPVLELRTTNPKHMSGWEPMDYREVQPRRVLDYLSTENANGNNVNAEEEFNLALENQLRYMLMANAATFEFSQINLALRSS